MNKFDTEFFKKFIPEWHELIHIIHIHPIVILKNLIVQIILLVWLPVWLFYFSNTVKTQIPFYYFEIYLFLIFWKIIYDIFNWYNDVWIITDSSVVALDWSLFKSKTESVNFDNIEWLWVDEAGVLDKLLKKWWLIIHKIWNEEFILEDAINPYKAIDIIEEASSWSSESEKNITDERFNMLLEAISGSVWDYVGKKNNNSYVNNKDKIKKEVIEKAEKSEGVIDLR